MDYRDTKTRAVRKLDRTLRKCPQLAFEDKSRNNLLKYYLIGLWFNGVADLMEYDNIPAGSTQQLMDALLEKGYSITGKQNGESIFLVTGEEFLVGKHNRIRPKIVGENYSCFPLIYGPVSEIVQRMEMWSDWRSDAIDVVDKAISKRHKLDVVKEIQFISMTATVEAFQSTDLNLHLDKDGCSIYLHFGLRETPHEWYSARVTMKSLDGMLAKIRDFLTIGGSDGLSFDNRIKHCKSEDGLSLPWK